MIVPVERTITNVDVAFDASAESTALAGVEVTRTSDGLGDASQTGVPDHREGVAHRARSAQSLRGNAGGRHPWHSLSPWGSSYMFPPSKRYHSQA